MSVSDLEQNVAVCWVDDDAGLYVVEKKVGLNSTEEVISIGSIDRSLSSQNRARDIPLDKERSSLIAASMLAGIPIPKIFVRKILVKGKTKYVIAGGNHREYAYTSINKISDDIPVHCVTCTDIEFEILCSLLNTVVGDGMQKAERVAKASDAVERLGWTQQEAANAYMIDSNDLSKHLRVLRFTRKHGIKSSVPKSHVLSISQSQQKSDPISKAWADVLNSCKMTSKEVADLSKKVDESSSEDEAIQIIQTESMIRKKVAKSPLPKPERRRFLSLLAQFEQFFDNHSSKRGNATPESLELLLEEREEVSLRCKILADILNTL